MNNKRALIRDANKVTLLCNEKGGNKTTIKEYRAFLTTDFAVNFQNEFGDLLESIGVGDKAAFLTNVAFGITPAFSMPRVFGYRGAQPLSISLNTVLVFEKDIEKDIINPLVQLIEMCAPSIKKDGSDGNVSLYNWAQVLSDKMEQSARKSEQSGKKGLALAQSATALSMEGVNTIVQLVSGFSPEVEKLLKDCHPLDLPLMLKSGVAVQLYYGPKNNSEATISMGPFLIKTVNFKLGPITVYPGYPDHVSVDIGLEFARTTDSSVITGMFPKFSGK